MSTAIDRVASRLADDLEAAVGRNRSVALVDFPYSRNCGDAAIWRGERASLAKLGTNLAYACDTESYERRSIADAIGEDGIILLHGGGNFGDLWPQHQIFREKILVDFPAAKIIQLPQSVSIRDPGTAERIKRIFSQHPNFLFMARDEASRVAMSELISNPVELVPDAALGLGPIDRVRVRQRQRLLVLARTDHERIHDLDLLGELEPDVSDWSQSRTQANRWNAKKIVPRIAKRYQSHLALDRVIGPARLACFDAMSRQLVAEAVRQLSRYDVVVTDRLHAHVLCSLVGIPHVVLDNSSGKTSGLYESWTGELGNARFAKTSEDALGSARELLHMTAQQP